MATDLDITLAAQLVKKLEGKKSVGYLDQGGKPTDGYGHTGPEVAVGRPVSDDVIDHNLDVDLATAKERLTKAVTPAALNSLTAHERAALISFVFNLGEDADWTIWKDINEGKLADVPTQMRRFVNVRIDGKLTRDAGLVNRREAEIVYWNTADLAAAAAVAAVTPDPAPSSYTRAVETPPTPVAPPAFSTASLSTKVVGAVAALGAGATQVHDIVAPHVSEAQIFGTAATICTGVGIVTAVILLLIHGAQHQAAKN